MGKRSVTHHSRQTNHKARRKAKDKPPPATTTPTNRHRGLRVLVVQSTPTAPRMNGKGRALFPGSKP
jgi:hypothetical protein